jgi:hypothetical protein
MTLYSWVCLGCDTNISIRDCLYCIWNVSDVSPLFYCRKLSLPGEEWPSNQLWHVQIFLLFHDIFTFWIPCCDVRYDFRVNTILGSIYPPVVCRRAHVIYTLFVFACAYCAMFLFSLFSGLSIFHCLFIFQYFLTFIQLEVHIMISVIKSCC